MLFVETHAIREADRQMIVERCLPGIVLMRRAGMAAARIIATIVKARAATPPLITCIAGKGNNGGDASVVAQILHRGGYRVQLLLAAPTESLRGDAAIAWNEAQSAGVPATVLNQPSDWCLNTAESTPQTLTISGLIVDGLLGTGATGAPAGVVAAAIEWINQQQAQGALVVALDLPSGLNANSGELSQLAVTADVTVTFALPKAGFPHAAAALGHVTVADIGLDRDIMAGAAATAADSLRLNAACELKHLLPPRPYASHKGDYGHVAIIGGANGFAGAPALTAGAALRGGTGLVTVAVPDAIATSVAAFAPEAMVHALPTPDGKITPRALMAWHCDLSRFDALVVGPGLTNTATTRDSLQWIIDNYNGVLVIDADGLNVLPQVQMRRSQPRIITPHPGEAARLLNTTTAVIAADRRCAAQQLAHQYGCTAVLKGAGTIVAANDTDLWLTLAGNPGMASGGSGDVLAGIIGALAAQKLPPPDAARLGVWLHAAAGDFALWQHGAAALTARDILEAMPLAFAALQL